MKSNLSHQRRLTRFSNHGPITGSLLLAALVVAPAAHAQGEPDDSAAEASGITLDQPRPLNRFALSYRLGLNFRARFGNLPSSTIAPDPSPVQAGSTYTYDDGFVAPDASFPYNFGVTHYWEAQRASQFGEIDPDYLSYHRASSAFGPGTGHSSTDTSLLGMEVSYSREISPTDFGGWGFETAFGFNNTSINESGTQNGTVNVRTESFFKGNILVPSVLPYTGPYPVTMNVPLIDSDPGMTTVSQEPAVISGTSDLDADIFGVRLGPYVDLQLSPKTYLHLSAGFATAVIDSELSFMEDTATALGGTGTRMGEDSKTSLVFGGYAVGQFVAKLNEQWDVFGGVQFQSLSRFNQRASSKSATLDLTRAVFINAGIGYSF